MKNSSDKSILLIAGPTASGKSAHAMEIARKRNGVIINADSMQVFSALRIITARPTPGDEAVIGHRLYGHIGNETYSVACWLREVEAEIQNVADAGCLPVICGGTGLYFRALEQGLASVPPIPDHIRHKWRTYSGDLHAELMARDRQSALRLNLGDSQRLVRALEVYDATGKSLIEWQKEAQKSSLLKGWKVERHFINRPRDELYARAEDRFDQMIQEGALQEIREMSNLVADHPLRKAIGVTELMFYLEGQTSLVEAIIAAKTATRHYIKRQLTWWRHQMKNWQIDQDLT